SEGLRPDRFYFMEMNTRLQVEHPVTEAITGVDLVEWQLRVASGEALWVQQSDLSITGHAFEARLYAEDAAAGFLPATGRLTHLAFPDGVRAETGVRTGDAISPWYDPMIAKLVVHGPTRGAALGALERALAGTQVAGTVTNLAFLRALARHEGFGRGEVDTGLIDREVETLTAAPVACQRTRVLAALLALGLDAAPAHGGFHLWAPLRWSVRMDHRGEEVAGTVTALGGGRYAVDLGDGPVDAAWTGTGFVVDGRPVGAAWHRDPGRLTVFWGNAYPFDLADPLDVATGAGAAAGVVEAPMPGLVKAVYAEAGASVTAGDRLAVLEAMKMEHVLAAPRDGVVAEMLCAPGDQVEAGAPLVRLEA
ncbi:MAG: biotin/lipoyl-containing protein, partial [Pseudomonadota bacterium]